MPTCSPACHTLVFQAAQAAAGRIEIGGGDCSAERAGAFTGDGDTDMLKDAGAAAVILGHSERRRIHHETNALVAVRAAPSWAAGLSTIVHIGQTEEQRGASTRPAGRVRDVGRVRTTLADRLRPHTYQ